MNRAGDQWTAARAEQARWQGLTVRERLHFVARFRALVARDGLALAEAAAAASHRPLAEKLSAEVIPLAAACEFLERQAVHVLRPRQLGRNGRPIWLSGVASEVCREPFGIVLVVGPANYPLFLPGVQALQALVAGNAVLLKPGRGGTLAARKLAALCLEAGLPAPLLQILPEPVEEVHAAISAGVDLVVFTGSSEAGQAVLAAAAPLTIPVIAELSGKDPLILRPDADLELAGRALRFGRALNGGDSCIAPRRVCAPAALAARLPSPFTDVTVTITDSDEAAAQVANASPYALGATIISRDTGAARRLAQRLNAGVVVINDCLMPTADPRMPFGGRKTSGFGVTRGPEGLLALTRPKVIMLQSGARRHLEPAHPGDDQFFLAYLQAAHGGTHRSRLGALLALLRHGSTRGRTL